MHAVILAVLLFVSFLGPVALQAGIFGGSGGLRIPITATLTDSTGLQVTSFSRSGAPTVWHEVIQAGQNTDACGTYYDFAHLFGHNINASVTPEVAGELTSFTGTESQFCNPTPLGNKLAAEFYWRYHDSAGVLHNLFSGIGSKDGTYADLAGNISRLVLNQVDGTTGLFNLSSLTTPPALFLGSTSVTGSATAGMHLTFDTLASDTYSPIRYRNNANSAYINGLFYDARNNLNMGDQAGVYWTVVRHGAGATNPGNAIDLNFSSTGVAGGDKGIFAQLPTSANWYYGWQMTGSFGDNFYNIFSNTNNATTNAHTKFILTTGGSSAGDPTFGAQISGVMFSYWGLDNTDNDAWVINANGTDQNLGIGNILRIETTGSQKGEMQLTALTQANLGTPTNGTLAYCSDCTVANPCAGGGSGALAKRLNGAWVCN